MPIQYAVEENPLTTPRSCRIRFVSRGSAGREDIAADIALRHPNFSKEDILTILNAEDEAVMARLLDGEQVTKEGCCTWFPSFTGKLDSPDDPLPPLEDCLHVNVRVSVPFAEDFCQNAQAERVASAEKLPVISSAEDTVLGLRDVLRADGMLRITGSNLAFDRSDPASRCLIEGTSSGSAVQSRIGTISNSEIILMPDVPAQAQPWHNEYRLSLTTHYTEHGSPRTGIYKHLLRTPLAVQIGSNAGILSSSGATPLVTVSDGTLYVDTVRLRVQAVYNTPDNELRFCLLDMTEGGQKGDEVRAADDGIYTLNGWSDSGVTSLELMVSDYAALLALVRTSYGNRLVDILDLSQGT